MKSIQIIEFTTSRIEELDALFDQWLAQTQGKRTATLPPPASPGYSSHALVCACASRRCLATEIVRTVFPHSGQTLELCGWPTVPLVAPGGLA
jgi:hypothetical protein